MTVHIDHFTYTYPGEATPALKEIDLEIEDGQICAVLGAAGAGKSTLCYAISGFIPHHFHGQVEGKIQVNGLDISLSSLSELAGKIGLVFQNPFNQITGARFTVREEIAFGLENMGLPREEILQIVDETIEQLDMADIRDRSPFEISGGQQQRLAIASILAMRPRVLVLDEPTSQLDPVASKEILQFVRGMVDDNRTTVVITEQNLEWIALLAERTIILLDGMVVADGTPHEVLTATNLSELGIRPLDYTSAAALAQVEELVSREKVLPISLVEATGFFK